MRITLLTVGKTDVDWVKSGLDLYSSRLKHYIPFVCLPELKNVSALSKDQIKEKEGAMLLKSIKNSDQVILLDERGKMFRSVEFAKYIQADGSEHIYITPVDWYNNPDTMRTATLKVGDNTYNLELRFGEITKIVAKGSLAVWPKDSAFEVLSAEPIKVQGVGETAVYVAKDGKITEKNIKISNTPIIEL